MSGTPNLGLPLETTGPVAMGQTIEKGFEILDEKVQEALDGAEGAAAAAAAAAPPEFTSDDIGKVLGVVDDGDGNPVLGWVTPGT